ncbi:L,D-transpeptidase family protein [Celeribacter indicus]|uniref:ErfK/YbiS/YcfS/YnhG family protein n=1 Tax=Celeribacter indicus TaxID=1208324 RepID=A0A0B5DP24_9RHOB|nr:L,D-transpeptidase family protein [Celeribacter indicus]AJE44959.1 ErfK/YbiS/YcfS/YnhG family protein [Celeribacter indicus]SDW96218.1 L,D-transpeptidase catalytic domain [Celeribacter indicus]
MDRRDFLISAGAFVCLPATVHARELKPYKGPLITRVVIHKERRRLYLLSGEKVVKKFRIGLGGNPLGPKRFEGDGKTPEGSYMINRRNPRSAYHLSLGISYPNEQDVAYAEAFGRRPGGDIFIHGRAGENRGKGRDWTAGCIAVKDRHIEKIYMMVRDGTQVDIFP